MEHKQRRNLLITLLVIGVLAAAFMVLPNEKTPQDLVMGREFVQDAKQHDVDVPSELTLSEAMEHVTQEVGQKESLMDDAEILSDGADKEADEIEMDKAQQDEEEAPVLVDEKEDGEEEDTGLQDKVEEDDADLDFLSDKEAAKQAVAVEEDRYPRPQCRRVRRCYHKYCSKRQKCRRICRRRRVCRRYGRQVRCVVRPYCYNHCPVCRSRCGVICRLRTHCRRLARVICYNRYCVRRFCARRCVRRGVRCRRYRRCYRRCVGVCGRRNRRCRVKCYHYRRCHPLNRCYNRCFIRRRVCGRRCVRRPVRRACYAGGALKLATDETGSAIAMKDVPVTKAQIDEMQSMVPDEATAKLMTVPDRYRGRWVRVSGALTNVAISSLGTLYGVNRADQIWTKRAWNRGGWRRLPGALKQISVNNAGTIVTGVNRARQIWYTRVTVRNLGAVKWASAPGRLVDVTSGGRFMYGVNSHDHIYRANLMNRNWCKLPGALVQISAHGTKVVGVNRGGFVYQYLGNGRWKHFGNAPRPARWASMGKDGDFWVIGRNQRIYRLAGRKFQQIPGALVQIDVADRRNVVGVNIAQQIWQWV